MPLELPDAQELRLPTAEAELAAVAAGDGPNVLLIHGWEGQASDLGVHVDACIAQAIDHLVHLRRVRRALGRRPSGRRRCR